jgi:hypothetical protein
METRRAPCDDLAADGTEPSELFAATEMHSFWSHLDATGRKGQTTAEPPMFT